MWICEVSFGDILDGEVRIGIVGCSGGNIEDGPFEVIFEEGLSDAKGEFEGGFWRSDKTSHSNF